jgi:hypothetical protein
MLGLNINALGGQHLDYISATKPPVNFLLNPKPESVADIKGRHPQGKPIGRPYVKDSDLHRTYLEGASLSRAQDAGKRAADICLSHAAAMPMVDAWLLLNEPPVDSIQQVQLLAEFDAAFVRQMAAGDRRGMIGAFARGTPQVPALDGGAALRAYEPALRAAHEVGGWLAIHQYGWHPLFHDARWHVTRWQDQALPWLRAQGIPIPPYVVTECGVDLNTTPGGWRATPYSTNPREYAEHLLQLMHIYARDPLCLGATIYCAGDNGDSRWRSFMVDGELLSILMGMAWPKPAQHVPTPTPTPAPTPKPEVPVADKLVQILQSKLGDRFKDVRAQMPNGRDKEGNPVSFDYADSRKMPIIALHYSASAAGPTTAHGIAKFHTDPTSLGGRGWAGIGYHFVIDGGVAYYVGHVDTQRAHVANRNDTALGVCWTGTYETSLPSAEDTEVGRLLIAGLDEFYGHQKKLMGHNQVLPGHTLCPGRIVEIIPRLRKPVPAPAPIPAPTPTRAALLAEAERRLALRFNPSAAIQQVILRDGFVPNSPEFPLTEAGITWICQRAERLSDSATRVYYVKQGDWGNIRYIEGKAA